MSPDPEPVPTVVLDLQPGDDHFGPEDHELVLAEVSVHLLWQDPASRHSCESMCEALVLFFTDLGWVRNCC